MQRLIMARHGQSTWNAARRIQGQSDPPLSELGQQQAARLGARLADETFAAIYASPLQRAWQTAQAVHRANPHHPAPVVEPRLAEQHFGAWEGLTGDEVRARDAEAHAAWRQDRNLNPYAGEDQAALSARAAAVLADLRARHTEAEHPVLFVAHGGLLLTLICGALGIPAAMRWHMTLHNTALAVLDFDNGRAAGGVVLRQLNDNCHLAGLDDVL